MLRKIAALYNKIANLIQRGIVTIANPVDINAYPIVQVQIMGKTGEMEVLSPYGLFSNVPIGSLGTVFNIQGNAANRAGIVYDPATRIKGLLTGEVAIGNPVIGTYFKFTAAGTIEVWKNHALRITDLSEHTHVDNPSPPPLTSVPNVL